MVDLEELKRLLAEATEGPWRSDCILPPEHATRLHTIRTADKPPSRIVADTLYDRDGLAIAALRNAAPALIEELEALREMAAATYSHVDGRDLLAEMRPNAWHFCDIRVRIAGQWKEYEGDWLKRVWMARSRVEALKKGDSNVTSW